MYGEINIFSDGLNDVVMAVWELIHPDEDEDVYDNDEIDPDKNDDMYDNNEEGVQLVMQAIMCAYSTWKVLNRR